MSAALPEVVSAGRIVPVLTVSEPTTIVAVGHGLLMGGIGCVEVTLRTPHAWDAIETLRRELPELVVGVGTVIAPDDVSRAADRGAQFMVAPGFAADSLERARELGLPALPGIATPSEAMAAMAAGFDTVKVFPASQLGGPDHLRTLSSVFPALSFVPSGGVSAENLGDYLSVPAVAAISGSWMLPSDAVRSGDSRQIAELSSLAVAAIAARA